MKILLVMLKWLFGKSRGAVVLILGGFLIVLLIRRFAVLR